MGSSSETSFFGPVENPIDKTRVPAVRRFRRRRRFNCVPAALGNDTGGSIASRQPARASSDSNPPLDAFRAGLIAYASSLDQIGPFATNVEDCATTLSLLCGQDAHDNTTSARPTEDFTRFFGEGIKDKVTRRCPRNTSAKASTKRLQAALENHLKALEKTSRRETPRTSRSQSIPYAISSYYIIATADSVQQSFPSTACALHLPQQGSEEPLRSLRDVPQRSVRQGSPAPHSPR